MAEEQKAKSGQDDAKAQTSGSKGDHPAAEDKDETKMTSGFCRSNS